MQIICKSYAKLQIMHANHMKNMQNMQKICKKERPDMQNMKKKNGKQYAKPYPEVQNMQKNMQKICKKERPDMQNKQTYANICKISQKYAVLFCVSIFCTYMQSMHRGLC